MTRNTRTKLSVMHDRDLDEEHEYPSALLNIEEEVLSPTKAARVHISRIPTKRASLYAMEKENPKRPLHILSEERDRVGTTSDPHSITAAVPLENSPASAESTFDAYMESVLSHCAGFYRVSIQLFVVQGWDLRRSQTTDFWYHLQFLWTQKSLRLGCSCPQGMESDCFHRRFFREYDVENLDDNMISNNADCKAIPFMRQYVEGSKFLTRFSVPSISSTHLTGRAIVTHIGSAPGSGIWKCSKDQGVRDCIHIKESQEVLQEQFPEDLDLTDEDLLAPNIVQGQDLAAAVKNDEEASVSYLPILPPSWAMIKSDPVLYARPPPYCGRTRTRFPLDKVSSCGCPTGRTFFDPTRPTFWKKCRVFTILEASLCDIEVQYCPTCPQNRRRLIGPDLRDLGLFNFNNSAIISHELLDEYTSAYTSSETPFIAWTTFVARRYEATSSTFMGEDLFRSVWFAYVGLQHLDGDMRCEKCGDYPETVIWDGVTLAFGRKQLRGNLSPPTSVNDESPIRQNTRYNSHQQLIPNETLRRQLRSVLKCPSDNLPELDDDDTEIPSSNDKKMKRLQAAIAHIELSNDVYRGLAKICKELSELFNENYGPTAFESQKKPHKGYSKFFQQIAAEESVVQIIPYPSLLALRKYLEEPGQHAKSQLISIPVLYNLLEAEINPTLFDAILRWLEEYARKTLSSLFVESPLLLPHKEDVEDWKKTGCCYSFPKIRCRPKYPKLTYDQKKEKSGSRRGDKCGKYYTTYGERRLTGGIMAAWCSHSICYGFHCIPESEGRNDIFSAMVTRWPVAPKYVIYDFACALGPYCMIREPQFFANTHFLIDHFHSMGHKKCSRATFLSEYANVDPELARINSSAAECGNGGIRKIRKSVSYMSQRRAIIYTRVFISMWNRMRLRK